MPRHVVLPGALTALLALPAAAQAVPPRPLNLTTGWEVRAEPAALAQPQPPPTQETEESSATPSPAARPAQRASQTPESWTPTRVPSVFETRALAPLYPGMVRRYRVRFRGPPTPRGFRWLLEFESVRRSARVFLNGRHLGYNSDPYTPFTVEARRLRPGRQNELMVIVDNRKDPRLDEGWWNWGGIVRPVRLVPVGQAHLDGLGFLSKVRCRGPATGCKASVLLDGVLERRRGGRLQPAVSVRLRSPSGRVTRKRFKLPRPRASRRRLQLELKVPAPELWAPETPRLYSAKVTLTDRGRVQQVVRRRIGLRSVTVKRGHLRLNNRRIVLKGASIHEDMPGHGAALTVEDMRQIVSDLKALGANVTRAHYLLNDRLLSMLDRAGIMVWNQAPIWQRDHRANLLQYPGHRRRALLTVRRTVKAARSHPSVITHSVANELSFIPDGKTGTRLFLVAAAQYARDIDPTLPISVDIKGRLGFPEQFVYYRFDMLGINQYFGWYSWVKNFEDLEPFLREMNDLYPEHALVMTEYGAEARPELETAPADQKGSYGFQAFHAGRTLDLVNRLPFLSGSVYWTLREFEIYPGWTGGPGYRRDPATPVNTRHFKGLMTYGGEPKPAFYAARDHFLAVPLYAP